MSGLRAIIDGVERTMEFRKPNTVQCDREGCGAEVYMDRYERQFVRDYAKILGWVFDGERDYCPLHGRSL